MVEKIGSNLPPEAALNTPATVETLNLEGTAGEGRGANGLQLLADGAQISENDLVVIDEGGGDASAPDGNDNSRLSLLQQRHDAEFERYLQYQRELVELQKQQNDYERQIRLHKDKPETVKRYQAKLEKVSGQISELKQNISQCEQNMQDLMTEYGNELANMAALSLSMPESAAPAALEVSGTAQTGAENPSPAGGDNIFTVNNAAYGPNFETFSASPSTTSIPQNLATSLDRRLGSGFSAKCEQVAGYLGCNVNDLLAMMYSESGLKTTARNKKSNAVGLIQFMPSTLRANGYTTEQVASMSGVQQLDVVADIFMKSKKMAGYGENEQIDGGTLYAINWLPAFAKRDTIATKGGKYYSLGLDMNKDGSVTKADLRQRLEKKYNEMMNNI